MSRKQVWKTDSQSQLSLLPPSYDDLVPVNHPVRVVNTILESIDLGGLEATYKGGGTSSYHPKVLLKILVYAYLRNLYSSRKIERALSENVHFMWLSGCSIPDHNTINNFRSGRLKGRFKAIFNQVVALLAEQGYLSLRDIYVDGTKIEANANRYTFVWAKGTKTSRRRIEKQLRELWSYVEKVYAQEEQLPNEPSFAAIDPEEVTKTVDTINDALKDKEVDKKVKQKLTYAKKNWPDKVAKYNEQDKILGNRGSYSKTDPDATFMRMKDDHMKNGQLKAGYNIQGSSNNQFLVNYTLEQSPTDTTTLPGHLEEHQSSFGQMPGRVTADSGYGSEENYQKMEDQGIDAFVKYNYFHKEQQEAKSGKVKKPFTVDKLHYNEQTDTYYCPMGQGMTHIGSFQRTTKKGYLQTIHQYQAKNCSGCPIRPLCHKAKGNRVVERNHNLERHKQRAREKLLSEDGIAHRKQRCWDIEAIFGNIKQNMAFKRFMLRGIEKVETEFGLIAMAHNLKKLSLAL
ncbi:IS1182 family transposase [Muricauda sp. SCSIO 64092]|uniref:IS1182 family transposase n=1 Tax=Allomuricauda sp. SCSIO 64092 TaxID=2908842 RepID=UPI001FF6EC73|nr:IS1182 family transposase [Muricauda sp. SCSIO 64092]UOY05677.1 IS1182 family transposase [Muricauda sp. SCSIO 64092]UOY06446.1 IS1182 family transposase [Muricauda sp. SCSIO 64092]